MLSRDASLLTAALCCAALHREQAVTEDLQVMREAAPSSFTARQSLREWLETNRLIEHELTFIELGGPGLGASDLAECTEEDIASLSSEMTTFEARRFEAALRALQSQSGRGEGE
jgi:hypothetical protein